MNISKTEKKTINDLLKGEEGVHWEEAFKRFCAPYKTTDLEWYKQKQEEKYGV